MISDWSEQILNSVFDVILVVDGAGAIIDANNAVQEIGYTPAGLAGKQLVSLTEDPDPLRDCIDKVASWRDEKCGARVRVRRADGSTYFADVSIRQIETTAEVDYLVILHDVDERARARKALEEQKALIEAALHDADQARQEAEQSKVALQEANDKLRRQQAITQQELEAEKAYRLKSQQTGFQKQFALILIGLIAFSLILPYVGSFVGTAEKVADSTNNLSLLLVQTLAAVAAFLFNREKRPGDGGD